MAKKEYIEREAVRNELYDADAITMSGVAILNNFPTADVVEVRHGHWIYNDGDNTCSVCRKEVTEHNDLGRKQWFNYCPHCGAKMDGKGEGE